MIFDGARDMDELRGNPAAKGEAEALLAERASAAPWPARLAVMEAEAAGEPIEREHDVASWANSRATRLASLFASLVAVGVIAGLWVPATLGGDSLANICRPGYAREHRLPIDAYYRMAHAAYERAGVPWSERHAHTIDHIVPLCLGGSNDLDNIQIQTIGAARRKDTLEWEACRRVCAGELGLDEARRWFGRSVP